MATAGSASKGWLRREPRLSTVLLAVIGSLDLASTVVLLRLGAAEANPLFSRLLEFGIGWFVLGKLLLLAGPILILEWSRDRAPRSSAQGAWIAVIAYLLIWGGQLLRLGWPRISP
jgi:predicted ABC-type exoprotein transport system permease subunit